MKLTDIPQTAWLLFQQGWGSDDYEYLKKYFTLSDEDAIQLVKEIELIEHYHGFRHNGKEILDDMED